MMISLELGPEFQKTVASMSHAGTAIADAVSAGLGKAVIAAADHVGQNFISGNLLKVRHGHLRDAVQGWKESAFAGVVGVMPGSAVEHYKYLLGGGPDFEIKPKKGKLLSIPMRDARDGSGGLKAEYSVGLLNIAGGFFKELTPGKLFFVKRAGKTKRSKLLVLFFMAPSVTAHPTDALAKGVIDATDKMTEILNAEVRSAIG